MEGAARIIEERCYTLRPGKLAAYLPAFEAGGLALQRRHLGDLIGYFTTETGVLNQVVHLWGFPDLVERERRRAGLWADPDWVAYADTVMPFIERMETRLLRPTAFSPLR